MENREVDEMNLRLIERYGLFENGLANFRIVFSDDQFEYRLGRYAKFDAHGNKIGESQEDEFMYVPKYRQWIPHMWVLEKLVPVPELNNHELLSKTSYEPLYPFMDNNYNPLPPKWELTELIIRNVLANMNKGRVEIVKDPAFEEADPKIALEVKEKRIKELEEQLWGNETSAGDALAHKSGVSYAGLDSKKGEIIQ
ncbi:MAG TPA: hypothetical protein VNX68_17905 [Nitrosopumilaceae archaeon]|jgi:hypothetical protein|nr:hypothetical protein [Nitrosopumilaceae archaeon]